MKRAVLFYYSIHHGNTKKVVEAIAEKLPVRLVSVPVREEVDLNEYDLVGFASGIYFSAFGKPMSALIDSLDNLDGKDCFVFYTCGAPGGSYDAFAQAALQAKGARIAGIRHCRGFDTYGPFKFIGGIAKQHPNTKDLEGAVRFVQSQLEQ